MNSLARRKRILTVLIGAALLAWAGNACHGAPVLDGEIQVMAKVVPSVLLTTGGAILTWNGLAPGENILEDAIDLAVQANVPYSLMIQSDVPNMKEQPASAGPRALKAPLEWSREGLPFAALSTTPAVVKTGGPTGEMHELLQISLRQMLGMDDLALENPNAAYSTIVRFTLSSTI